MLILGLQQKRFRAANTHRTGCSAAQAARALGLRESTTTGKTQTQQNLTKLGTSFDLSFARCPFFDKAWKFLPPAHCWLINASNPEAGQWHFWDRDLQPLVPRGPGAGPIIFPPAKEAAAGRPGRSGATTGPQVPTPRPWRGAVSGPSRRQQPRGGHACPRSLPALPRRRSSGRGRFSDPEHEPGASPGRSPRRLAPLRRDWARGGEQGPRAGGLGPGGEGAGGRSCSSVPHDESPEAAAAPEEAGRDHLASSLPSSGRCPGKPHPLRHLRLGFSRAPRSSCRPRRTVRAGPRDRREKQHPRARAHWTVPLPWRQRREGGRREGAWPPWLGCRRGWRYSGRSISL